jgi:hypothetical protein
MESTRFSKNWRFWIVSAILVSMPLRWPRRMRPAIWIILRWLKQGARLSPAYPASGDMVLQPDGKIVATGRAGTDLLVMRYLSNGTDPSFDGDGIATIPNGQYTLSGRRSSNRMGRSSRRGRLRRYRLPGGSPDANGPLDTSVRDRPGGFAFTDFDGAMMEHPVCSFNPTARSWRGLRQHWRR